MEPSLESICLNNVNCWWKHRGIGTINPVKVFQDRVFYPRDQQMEDRIDWLVKNGFLIEFPSKNHGKDIIMGWREDVGTFSAQVIIHTTAIEIDFDYFNPRDLVGLFGHAWELLVNFTTKRKTDPRKVAKALKKRGIIT